MRHPIEYPMGIPVGSPWDIDFPWEVPHEISQSNHHGIVIDRTQWEVQGMSIACSSRGARVSQSCSSALLLVLEQYVELTANIWSLPRVPFETDV